MKVLKFELPFLKHYVISSQTIVKQSNNLPQDRGKLLQHLGLIVTPYIKILYRQFGSAKHDTRFICVCGGM